MSDMGFDVSELAGINREELLLEAAQSLDALRGHLGGESQLSQTPEGNLVRELAMDKAEFAQEPVIYRITAQDFLTRNLPVPIHFKELSQNFNFYFLAFPFDLRPGTGTGWSYNQLVVKIEFNPGDAGADGRPKVYQIFPSTKFQTFFEADANLEVSLDPNFEFSANTGSISLQAGSAAFKGEAGLGAKLAGGAGVVIGPLAYSVKRAIIKSTQTGLEWTRWEFGATTLGRGDDPQLWVIAQVPKQTKTMKIRGELVVNRYFNLANYSFREAIKNLRDTWRRFIEGGAPLYYKPAEDWDVTKALRLDR
jgi:hypothetical protein